MLADQSTLRRLARSGRKFAARAAASALFVAAMANASTAHALQSSTVVVAKGDTISGLFRTAKVPQRELMRLLRSSPVANRRLERVRDGAILSLSKDEAGKLQRVQVTSRTGKQVTFFKTSDPQTGSQIWQFVEGAFEKSAIVAAASPAAPLAQGAPNSNADDANLDQVKSLNAGSSIATTATGVSEAVAKLAYIAPPKVNVQLSNAPLAAHVREAEQRKDGLRGNTERHSTAAATVGERPAPSGATSRAAKLPAATTVVPSSTPSRSSKRRVSHSVTPTRMLASAVRDAEGHLLAKRLIAQATSETPTQNELSGLSARVFEAEYRVHRTRARYELLAIGTRAVRSHTAMHRGGDGRVRKVLSRAKRLIGAPYLWGGTTPRGFDCSGFVVYNLNKVGINVPRTAHQQFNHTRSRPVSRKDLRPGDLVFFHDRTNRKRIGHVGIFIGNNNFIHAVKKDIPVKITSLEKAYYRKRFVRGGRVIS